MNRLLASAPTDERLLAMIRKFYGGSTTVRIVGSEVHNANGPIAGVRVVQAKGRWRFEATE